jgi:hypothetical protein
MTDTNPLNRWGDHTPRDYLTQAGMGNLVRTLRELHDNEFDGLNECFIRDTAGLLADLLTDNWTWDHPDGRLKVSWSRSDERLAYERLHAYVGGLKRLHDDLLPEDHAPMLTAESMAVALARGRYSVERPAPVSEAAS